MTRNLLTGEKTVVSTATVPAEDLKHHAGIKVYDDGRKCVYALNSQEVRSHEQARALARLLWLVLNTESKVLETKVNQQPIKRLSCAVTFYRMGRVELCGCYRNRNE